MDNSYLKDHSLFDRYINVCNVALSKNAHRFPFQQILKAAEEHTTGRFACAVIEGEADKTLCILCIRDGKIIAEEPAETNTKRNVWHIFPCGNTWRVSKAYINDVVENAPRYIENPALLNWEWLYPKDLRNTH